jgi:predicted class III extradiol MEMO1 family dioxygenase
VRFRIVPVVFRVLAKTTSKFVSEALAEKAWDREIA